MPLSYFKRYRKRILFGAGALIIFIIAGAASLAQDKHPEADPALTPVEVTTATLTASVKVLGNIQATRQVDLGTQASGQIKKLYVKVGDNVKNGALLAEIDPTLARLDANSARLNLERSRATLPRNKSDLAFVRAQLERETRLLAAEAIGRDQLDKTRKQCDDSDSTVHLAELDLAGAQLAFDSAQAKLSKTTIVAPFDGVITDIPTQEGQTLNSSQQTPTVLKMAVLATVNLRLQVPEPDISKVALGQRVVFTSYAAPDSKFEGKVESIRPVPEKVNNAMFFIVNVPAANAERKLWPEMTVEASLIGSSAKGATLPLAALGEKQANGSYKVKVRAANGTLSERTVRTGITDGERIIIASGLVAGEKVMQAKPAAAPKS